MWFGFPWLEKRAERELIVVKGFERQKWKPESDPVTIWPFPPWPLEQNQRESPGSPYQSTAYPVEGAPDRRWLAQESWSLLGMVLLINVPWSRVGVLFMPLEAYGRTSSLSHTPLFLFSSIVVSTAHQSWGWREEQSCKRNVTASPRELIQVISKWRLKTWCS